MASKEVQRMFLRGVTSSEQPPQETKKIVTTGDILIKAKNLYNSWSVEEYNITFKQALGITRDDLPSSDLIPNPEKLDEMKRKVRQISQESGLKVTSLFLLDYSSIFEDDILRQFGDNPKLRLTTLKDLYKDKKLSDNEKNDLARESTKENGTAHFRRTAMHIASQNYYNNTRKPFHPTSETIVPRELPKPTLTEPSKVETPTIEKPPTLEDTLFEAIPFPKKFEIIKDFEREYRSGGQTNRNIPILEAIDLVQPNPENQNSRGPEQISSLKTWFEIHHLEIHNLNVSRINKRTFSSFLKANSNIIPFFDNQDSDTKLGEATFRIITNKLSDNIYKKLQFFISKILLTIPPEDRPNADQLENYIEKCKLGFNSDISDDQQEKRISTIYSETTKSETTSSTSEFIAKLFQ